MAKTENLPKVKSYREKRLIDGKMRWCTVHPEGGRSLLGSEIRQTYSLSIEPTVIAWSEALEINISKTSHDYLEQRIEDIEQKRYDSYYSRLNSYARLQEKTVQRSVRIEPNVWDRAKELRVEPSKEINLLLISKIKEAIGEGNFYDKRLLDKYGVKI